MAVDAGNAAALVVALADLVRGVKAFFAWMIRSGGALPPEKP